MFHVVRAELTQQLQFGLEDPRWPHSPLAPQMNGWNTAVSFLRVFHSPGTLFDIFQSLGFLSLSLSLSHSFFLPLLLPFPLPHSLFKWSSY